MTPLVPLDTVEQLLAAAARHGLVLTADSAALDTMGLDFLVVHARDAAGVRWVVRSPRRPDVAEAARHEARVLRLVRRHLPVAAPEWRVHADDVIAYPRLDGVPAVTLDTGAPVWNVIDPAAPAPAFVDSLAAALAALQGISEATARGAGITVTPITAARDSVRDAIAVAATALEIPAVVLARWTRWLDDDALWPAHLAMSHGDLHPGHLLLEPGGRVSGILDWTEAKLTEPSTDFAMVHMCFGRAVLDDVIAGFAAHGGTTWPGLAEAAVERAAAFPALGAAWAVRHDNAMAMEMARAQLATLTTATASVAP